MRVGLDGRIGLAVTLGLALAAAAGSGGSDLGVDRTFLRGMIVSCPRGGQIWGSPQMADALAALDELGVEWVGIHPYAGVRRDGTVVDWRSDDTGYLARANRMVREGGFGLFWKPHLGYWGSFEWRGAITFEDEASWNRFFTGYRTFILDQARLAARFGAEIFAIGVELEGTTHRPEWRALLAEVRSVYPGRITYAANWDRLDDVPFWSALDLIGVHAYFPLGAGSNPSDAELLRSWESALTSLHRISEGAGGRPVLFAEIGYNRSSAAAREPWSHRMEDSPQARRLRQRLIEVAIERLEGERLIEGMFWWKWIPGPTGHDRDFSMKDPEARTVLARLWGSAAARPRAGTRPTTPSSGHSHEPPPVLE